MMGLQKALITLLQYCKNGITMQTAMKITMAIFAQSPIVSYPTNYFRHV